MLKDEIEPLPPPKKFFPDHHALITNIAVGSPSHTWMEYCADWPLIERDALDITGIYDRASRLGIAETKCPR